MDQFLGQILLVPYTFAPSGWAFCQGQMMAIRQNTALFALLGNTFGGDGKSTFALPNLQGSVAVGVGAGPGQPAYAWGQTGGSANATLNLTQIPAHTHQQQGETGVAASASPANATFADTGGRGHGEPYYIAPSPSQLAPMNANSLAIAGSGQPHANIMPSLVLNYIIALQGIFPSRP